MSLPVLVRVWHIFVKPTRCRSCREKLVWMIDLEGKYRPFRPDIKPIAIEEDEKGRRIAVYEPTVFHRCRRQAS